MHIPAQKNSSHVERLASSCAPSSLPRTIDNLSTRVAMLHIHHRSFRKLLNSSAYAGIWFCKIPHRSDTFQQHPDASRVMQIFLVVDRRIESRITVEIDWALSTLFCDAYWYDREASRIRVYNFADWDSVTSFARLGLPERQGDNP
jgi:hypothetical protein